MRDCMDKDDFDRRSPAVHLLRGRPNEAEAAIVRRIFAWPV
jgi:hypothetical protein